MKSDVNNILSFSRLEAGYIAGGKHQTVIADAFASAFEGELIAVIGRNGAGKSTLLRTIAGIQPLISGSLIVGGKELKDYSRSDLSRNVGYISTETVRVGNMRVYDLVAQGRFPYTNWFGTIEAEDNDAIMASTAKAGMTGFENRMLNELSDGERQRAMIAMILAQDAKLMVMDEPTAFLDISNKFEISNLLRDLAVERNKTIIFSTHDPGMAISMADKIWIIHDRSLLEGAPEDLILRGEFSKLFNSSRVIFDSGDGSFRMPSTPGMRISLKGEGKYRFWTMKALERAGYATDGSDKGLLVEAPNETETLWKCSSETGVRTFKTVYDLIRWLGRKQIIC